MHVQSVLRPEGCRTDGKRLRPVGQSSSHRLHQPSSPLAVAFRWCGRAPMEPMPGSS